MSKELSVTVNRCPVFGCAIPRGIPHEHPAGVSAVMRDPVAPLSANERIELLYHRHLASVRNQMEFNKMASAVMAQSEVERQMRDAGAHVIRDAPMVQGRKLRDALLLAGFDTTAAPRSYSFDARGQQVHLEPLPVRRTLAQSIGKFMVWMFSIPALLLAAFAIGTYCGWWV